MKVSPSRSSAPGKIPARRMENVSSLGRRSGTGAEETAMTRRSVPCEYEAVNYNLLSTRALKASKSSPFPRSNNRSLNLSNFSLASGSTLGRLV